MLMSLDSRTDSSPSTYFTISFHQAVCSGRSAFVLAAASSSNRAIAKTVPSSVTRHFAELWQAADKIVYSSTLDRVATTRTRIERTFDTDAVRQLKSSARSDLLIGGAGLAASAFAAGLVDELHLFIAPVIV